MNKTIICLLSMYGTLSAMQEETITFPEPSIIRKRLINQGMAETALDKTKIDKHFAHKNMLPSRIPTELKQLYKYRFPHLNKKQKKELVNLDLPKTIAALLSDHPQAIRFLEENGTLKRSYKNIT